MAIVSTNKFVKFVRGTSAAFNQLLYKDPDTLYFISEVGASVGDLYLGSVKITDGAAISDLDIDIDTTTLQDGQVLQYNSTTEKWENQGLTIPVMTGASAQANGTSGLVPVPVAGTEGMFLRGDATWANPVTATAVKDALGISQASVGDLLQVDSLGDLSFVPASDLFYSKSEVDTMLAGVTGSSFETVQTLPATGDSNKIYLVPKQGASASDPDAYVEWVYTNNKWEKVGETGTVNLTDYVRVDSLDTSVSNLGYVKSTVLNDYVLQSVYDAEVGDLSTLIKSTSTQGDTLVEQVNDLTNRLSWVEITAN